MNTLLQTIADVAPYPDDYEYTTNITSDSSSSMLIIIVAVLLVVSIALNIVLFYMYKRTKVPKPTVVDSQNVAGPTS